MFKFLSKQEREDKKQAVRCRLDKDENKYVAGHFEDIVLDYEETILSQKAQLKEYEAYIMNQAQNLDIKEEMILKLRDKRIKDMFRETREEILDKPEEDIRVVTDELES